MNCGASADATRRLQVNALQAFIVQLDDDARRVLGQFVSDEGAVSLIAKYKGIFYIFRKSSCSISMVEATRLPTST